eukprot:CAMPEP_0119493584 /NCGR_PEP_ID=MMETSP1344-20130328/17799_1 /TAXON_ID=236787 /ORGANISM="Florenciella parvula, Strain CCMP2471" /LENGTH=214 /DNA_ID=CAMNT_0007529023 /DNA_START=300 /DNA_END=940 /DNA_ORIENTATION=-
MNRELIGTDRIANKSIRTREIARVQNMHKARLAKITGRKANARDSTLDMARPHTSTMKHVHQRLKTRALKEERQNAIHHENQDLLKKMARIATSTSDTYTAGGRKDGALNMQILNSMGRKIRLEKISKENKKFLERLVNTKSYFSQAEWDATREEEEVLLARLRKFEYEPPEDSLAATAESGLKELKANIRQRSDDIEKRLVAQSEDAGGSEPG